MMEQPKSQQPAPMGSPQALVNDWVAAVSIQRKHEVAEAMADLLRRMLESQTAQMARVSLLTDAEIDRLIAGIPGYHSEMHLRHLIATKVESEVRARFELRDAGVLAFMQTATAAQAD